MLDIVARPLPDSADALDATLHPVLARVLRGRGVTSAAELDYRLDRLLRPDALDGMDAAAALVVEQLRAGGRFLVCGDYDADGATALTLVVRALTGFGARDVHWRVPNRFRHGYGLTPELVAELAELAPALLITVDHGTASVSGVAAANAAGFRVLVTDHHLAGDTLPAAAALLNPNLPDSSGTGRALAGCGVAFYLMLAVRQRLRELGHFADGKGPNLAALTDLVALGTVADLVPLDHGNRILVRAGLERIRRGLACPGIGALLDDAGRAPNKSDTGTLGFQLAPRLNAAGRLDDMSIGIRCLLADAPAAHEARALARQLGDYNRERRAIQQDMQAEAELAVDGLSGGVGLGLVVHDPGWHAGVVGLVASRLVERHHRPTLALAPADEDGLDWRGSGRSIPGVHLRDVLALVDARHPGLMTRYGGHAMAAGLSIRAEALPALAAAFDAALAEWGAAAHLTRRIATDGGLRPADLTVELAQLLADAGPWGQHFPPPLFDNVFRVLQRRWLKERHLRLTVAHPDGGAPVEAIWFGAIDAEPHLHEAPRLRLLYELGINDWMDSTRLQLVVQRALDA